MVRVEVSEEHRFVAENLARSLVRQRENWHVFGVHDMYILSTSRSLNYALILAFHDLDCKEFLSFDDVRLRTSKIDYSSESVNDGHFQRSPPIHSEGWTWGFCERRRKLWTLTLSSINHRYPWPTGLLDSLSALLRSWAALRTSLMM